MTAQLAVNLDRSIARCRVVLSLVAFAAILIDTGWLALNQRTLIPITTLHVTGWAIAVACVHLSYSLAVYSAVVDRLVSPAQLARFVPWADVAFSYVVACFTTGASSPFYTFFVFALMSVGVQNGMRRTLQITAASVGLSLSLFAMGAPATTLSMARPLYLIVLGYLFGHIGERRLRLEREAAARGIAHAREQIARDLHDGCVQTLAALGLRLSNCQELLARGRSADARDELRAMQAGLESESDMLRAYMRSLVGLEQTAAPRPKNCDTVFSVSVEFTGSAALLEQVLYILRESATNVQRHAQARSATLRVHTADGQVVMAIEDDGVGLDGDQQPWSIASRVRDLKGVMAITAPRGAGARLAIALPQVSAHV